MKLSIEMSLFPLLYIPVITILLLIFSAYLYRITKMKQDLYILISFSIITTLSLLIFPFIDEPGLVLWDKPYHLAGIILVLSMLPLPLFGDKQMNIRKHIPLLLLTSIIVVSYFFISALSGTIFTLLFIGYGLYQLTGLKNGTLEGGWVRSFLFLLIGVFSFVGQWLPFKTGGFLFSVLILVFLMYECVSYFKRVVNLYRSAGINSILDSLTGLFNKGFLFKKVEQLLSKQPISIIFIDIDNFKQLNDTKGHEHGDKVLKEVGNILKSVISNKGFACRYGGEEMVGIVTTDNVNRLAEQFRELVEKKTEVTVSVGVATGNMDGAAIIKLADERMYRAKTSRKNMVVYSDN